MLSLISGIRTIKYDILAFDLNVFVQYRHLYRSSPVCTAICSWKFIKVTITFLVNNVPTHF